jgi:nucleotide-binding universal stress UspA family protein
MYQRILLAYDGTAAGQQALLDCKEIAQWSRAEMHLIAVMPSPVSSVAIEGWVYDPEVAAAERAQYQQVLDQGVQRLSEAGLSARGVLATGHSVDEIVRHARQVKVDLIVVGHKHLDSWAQRWWRGSVSQALIEHAPCSVLVVITH